MLILHSRCVFVRHHVDEWQQLWENHFASHSVAFRALTPSRVSVAWREDIMSVIKGTGADVGAVACHRWPFFDIHFISKRLPCCDREGNWANDDLGVREVIFTMLVALWRISKKLKALFRESKTVNKVLVSTLSTLIFLPPVSTFPLHSPTLFCTSLSCYWPRHKPLQQLVFSQ